MKARTLKAAVMRKLSMDASGFLRESLEIDPLYMGCLYEQAAGKPESGLWRVWTEKMRDEAHNYLELSLDYGKAGGRAGDSGSVSGKKPHAPVLSGVYVREAGRR